jgi:hypothetical protein
MIVLQRSICSSTTGFLTMIPRRAASDTAPMIATGMAIKRGQGVAVTSTARNRTDSPLPNQAAKAMAIAIGV